MATEISSTRSALVQAPSRVSYWVLALLAVALFAMGLGIRLYDLTDQPLDFHPTRQLRAAIIARGMYYQMLPGADPHTRAEALRFWSTLGRYEPPFLERIVAWTYLALGKETLWVSRIYTSLFWIIAGLALFGLARRLGAGELESEQEPAASGSARSLLQHAILGAALVAVAYFLLLPFAVQASRSFQPDPWMVMWIVLSAYCFYRWSLERGWVWAILAGLLAGIGVLVKAVAAYIVGGAALGMVLYSLGFKRALRSLQVWVMAILMVTPSAVYYLIENQGRAAQYFTSWTLSLSHLLLEPSFYVRWFNFVQNLMGLGALLLALIGVLIAAPRARALLLGLWIGYGIYGLTLPYQMYTHSYYHLQLVPIIALSLVPVMQAVLERVVRQPAGWQVMVLLVALGGAVFQAWVSVSAMAAENDRAEPAYWEKIASYLPDDGKIMALTQDYGFRLIYYGWRRVVLWPNRGEISLSQLRGSNKEFENYFAKRTENMDYFLITAFGQFKDQPDLKEMLERRYPLYASGDGYLIYDLSHPVAAAP